MRKNNKAFSLVEIIIAMFILSVAILSIVALKSQLLNKQDELLSSYKIIYFSNYINKIIEAKTPNHSAIGEKNYIIITGENINYSGDIANKTKNISFFENNKDTYKYEHEIEYVETKDLDGIDYYVFKITLKVNNEEKIYYVTA